MVIKVIDCHRQLISDAVIRFICVLHLLEITIQCVKGVQMKQPDHVVWQFTLYPLDVDQLSDLKVNTLGRSSILLNCSIEWSLIASENIWCTRLGCHVQIQIFDGYMSFDWSIYSPRFLYPLVYYYFHLIFCHFYHLLIWKIIFVLVWLCPYSYSFFRNQLLWLNMTVYYIHTSMK